MDNETMVDEMLENEDLDEELQIEEDTPEEDESVVLEQEDEEPVEETPQPQRSEPGYVQKRIAKALAQERESIRAEVEAMYAPLRDRLLEMDAKELVRQGEFKSVERAKEYLQLKQGAAPVPQYQEPVEESDPGTDARIDMLAHQADVIKAEGGPDVISEFQKNKEIKNKVINGEMDFYDVARAMGNRKRPPSPMRSPNGVGGISTPIASMSDAQFAKLDKMLDEGVRFTSRR